MGNRAVITTQKNFDNNGVGIYLHWNGGRDSIEGFLRYCKLRGFRCPEKDCYGWARLCQVAANFVDQDGLSVGIDKINKLDCNNFDNGTYLIKNWEISGRRFFDGEEQNSYDLTEVVLAIDRAQPVNQQLGKDMIIALMREGKTISDVCSYDYMWKNNRSEALIAAFEIGKKYRLEYTKEIAKISDKTDKLLTVTIHGKESTIPYFKWRNGNESAICDFEGKQAIIYSAKEAY